MKTEEVLKLWRDVVVAAIGCGDGAEQSACSANLVCLEYAKFVEKVNNATP
jgi:hypothetical protein